ncbi:MAG TPA: tRNA epoxyqueuosine(34) reductase QueG [Acidobacteriota bacterium]|nr:tRNA epoxyqueuosine(34) reductase QueG [Acidobacteriota bacterium]
MMTAGSIPELTRKIRREVSRLGFAGMGVARAGPLPRAERFDAWLENGLHGRMEYIERQAEKRRDPRIVLPDARTVLILAVNYYDGSIPCDTPLKGRISRYARCGDYHPVVKSRLLRLFSFIRRMLPSVKGVCHVDTGPVMEKVWGAESALGWMGKNTTLIARGGGSWFFIGVILLDAVLEYDRKEKDFCGSCRRCIDACPTGALDVPYVLDARRCISRLTVECRGVLPRPYRAMMGNRIFGCDDCQEACPWNRFARPGPDAALVFRDDCAAPDLAELAALTGEEFALRFTNSPIRRVTRDGFVRNCVVALGNSGRDESTPALANAMRDASSLVRIHAAWSLGRIASPASHRVLREVRAYETDPLVLEEIDCALAGGN